ncbi:HOP1 [Symbiodinium natans]|uniref:Hsp70-Hsp90 organising protein n=1 Tax=Symbiodinium natans TaxID=878477 RepID=A0A812I1N3_9DINO|nr:HOP1 [Symbiodinium natans]
MGDSQINATPQSDAVQTSADEVALHEADPANQLHSHLRESGVLKLSFGFKAAADFAAAECHEEQLRQMIRDLRQELRLSSKVATSEYAQASVFVFLVAEPGPEPGHATWVTFSFATTWGETPCLRKIEGLDRACVEAVKAMADKAKAAEAKAKGNVEFQAKNFKEAIKHFTEAIKHDPSDHVFFSNRSACYASLEDYDKALEDGTECVRLKPDWPKGYTRKGLAEFFLKKYDDAAETYKAGLKLAPEDATLKEGLKKAMDAKYDVPGAGWIGGLMHPGRCTQSSRFAWDVRLQWQELQESCCGLFQGHSYFWERRLLCIGLAAAQNWPGCQEQNTVIRNAGQALFTNLQGYGATIGCFLDDCMSSDKFVASEIESCAKVCFSLPECKFWVWGTEEGEQKCWFRTGDAGREAGEGWVSGSKACAPPGTTVLPLGNSECWAEGFGYENCCEAKFGPNGNAQCWDGVYNYDRCCFPKEEL